MSEESRRVAGILLVVLPTVIYGGVSLLTMLISPGSGYMENPLRQNLFRAGHAHAGVLRLHLSRLCGSAGIGHRASGAWRGLLRSRTEAERQGKRRTLRASPLAVQHHPIVNSRGGNP
jgi:hypothetical protein